MTLTLDAALILYRLLSPLIGLVMILRSLWAVVRGEETFSDLRERVMGPRLPQSVIWIHGASVGEMNAARPIISMLSADTYVLVTATTVTGRRTVQEWGLPRVTAHLAPLDWVWIADRLLRKVHALIIIENELWPNRIIAAQRLGLPVIMINARISKSSAQTWTRFAPLARRVLSPMQLIAPQDAQSAERLRALGATKIAPPLNLKGLYAPNLSSIPEHLRTLARTKTILAAATHKGEEDTVLSAFHIVRQTLPDARLIIAPRHPTRGEEIAQLVAGQGFTLSYRSSDDLPDQDIYLADTLGDMHLWYRLAGVAFIGGSLVEKGGHTPFEPTAYGCPILHGPHVSNFAESYARLDAAHAAHQVTDAQTLAASMTAHLGDDAMADRAKAALEQPDIAPLLDQIKAALGPRT